MREKMERPRTQVRANMSLYLRLDGRHSTPVEGVFTVQNVHGFLMQLTVEQKRNYGSRLPDWNTTGPVQWPRHAQIIDCGSQAGPKDIIMVIDYAHADIIGLGKNMAEDHAMNSYQVSAWLDVEEGQAPGGRLISAICRIRK
jgi:hypothetical protein